MTTDHNNQPSQTSSEKNQPKVSMSFWLISVFISLALGAIGMNFLGNAEQKEAASEVEEEETVTLPEEFSAVSDLYQLFDERLASEVNPQKLVDGALKGMAEATEDPYTQYMNAEEAKDFDTELSGSFGGIGAEVIKEDDVVRVVAPIAGSPAEKAGLLTNDLIRAVDGQSVAPLNLKEAVDLIRGEKGTTVELLIERQGATETIAIERGEVPIESVRYEVIENDEKIAHIHLTSFSDSTYQELLDALKESENQGIEKTILDVRGNPGGLLSAALEISNLFVPNGQPLMQAKTTTQDEPDIYEASDEYGSLKFDGEAVLLVDEGSASAAEILAGALKSIDIPLVGVKTFGKGTIQSVQKMSTGGDIKFTMGEWLTAEGEQINGQGIKPDYQVEAHPATEYRIIDARNIYQLGDDSEEVKNIKNILNTLSYPVTDSTVFDEKAKQAVTKFQLDHQLEANGQVTGETAHCLVQSLRDFIKENDPQIEKAVQLLTQSNE